MKIKRMTSIALLTIAILSLTIPATSAKDLFERRARRTFVERYYPLYVNVVNEINAIIPNEETLKTKQEYFDSGLYMIRSIGLPSPDVRIFQYRDQVFSGHIVATKDTAWFYFENRPDSRDLGEVMKGWVNGTNRILREVKSRNLTSEEAFDLTKTLLPLENWIYNIPNNWIDIYTITQLAPGQNALDWSEDLNEVEMDSLIEYQWSDFTRFHDALPVEIVSEINPPTMSRNDDDSFDMVFYINTTDFDIYRLYLKYKDNKFQLAEFNKRASLGPMLYPPDSLDN